MSYSYSQKSRNRFRDNNRKPFYYIRKGAALPDGLKVLHVSDDILRCWNRRESEAFTRIRIDTERHGFNALMDLTYGDDNSCSIFDCNANTVRGRPALLVPANAADSCTRSVCNENFSDLIYCISEKKQAEEAARFAKLFKNLCKIFGVIVGGFVVALIILLAQAPLP